MKRRLEQAIHYTDSRGFWLAVFFVSVLFVFAYSFASNRRTIAEHERLIAAQQQQLTYLCETVAVLDTIAAQQLRIVRETLTRTDVPLWGQVYLAKRERLLGTTHEELSDIRGCRQIE